MVGLNHRTAPLEVRERFALTRSQLPQALRSIRSTLGHGVVLSTCNRFEVYVSATGSERQQEVEAHLSDQAEIPFGLISGHLYRHVGADCVRHLYRVACGLDSMVVGEEQILGQVRDAFSSAAQTESLDSTLSHLFHQAMRTGRRVRRETGIGRNALSVSRAAVELARRQLGDLDAARVLVIGAGDAGKLVAKSLGDAGARDVIVTNRTYQGAVELAEELGGRAVTFQAMPHALASADIVISCTGSPGFILGTEMLGEAIRARPSKSLVVIDIAVPRDVDPEAGELPNVFLYDVDDIRYISDADRVEREREVQLAEWMVEREVAYQLNGHGSVEGKRAVSGLRSMAEAIRRKEMTRLRKRLDHRVGDEEIAYIEAMSRAIVNKLLHKPTTRLKERPGPDGAHVVRDLFDLDGPNPTLSERNGQRR